MFNAKNQLGDMLPTLANQIKLTDITYLVHFVIVQLYEIVLEPQLGACFVNMQIRVNS